AGDVDQPDLRRELTLKVAQLGKRVVIDGTLHNASAAALPFGPQESSPIGALLAWRGGVQGSRQSPFTAEELLFLETLADYAAVALETTRLANEKARLSRDAAHIEGERRAELLQREALRHSEERFRSLVQNASDVIAILDAQGRIGYASPAAQAVWGQLPEALRGASLLDLVHPDEQGGADAFLASL